MNLVKREKNNNYTTISNLFLRNIDLSIKAKGFLALIMSLPEDWDFTINGICKVIKEGKTAIYNIINELKEKGYCKVDMCRNEKGLITGNDYTFSETPREEWLNTVNPSTLQPHTENPNMDKPTQINKDINNKRINKEKEYSFKEEYSTKKVAETFENVENNKSVGTGYPVKTVSYVEKEKENVSPKEKESRGLGFRIKMRFNALVTGTPDCKINRIRGVRNNRLQSIKARIAEYGEDALYDAFKNAASSDFLNGRVSTDRGTFIATFDWIIRPNNFPKVLEGNYNNRHNSSDRSNISGHREKLRDTMSVYNTYNILGKERYNKFMAWLAKTCPYVYEYYHVLISCEEFYSIMGDIDKEQKFLNIICALGKNPEEMKAHDNLYEYVKSKMDV